MTESNSNHHSEDEQQTRARIDLDLRKAGWLADSMQLRFSQGARPKINVNQAIAEWPTKSGPADYVLFVGLHEHCRKGDSRLLDFIRNLIAPALPQTAAAR